MAGQAFAIGSLQQHPCPHRDEQNLAGCWVWGAGYLPSPQVTPMAMVMLLQLLLDKAILKLIFFLFWAVLEEAKSGIGVSKPLDRETTQEKRQREVTTMATEGSSIPDWGRGE